MPEGKSDQSDLPNEGTAADKDAATLRYAGGTIMPSDDDSHLSDHAYLTMSGVRDPNDVVVGVHIKK